MLLDLTYVESKKQEQNKRQKEQTKFTDKEIRGGQRRGQWGGG